jgi:predicted amidohydrolase
VHIGRRSPEGRLTATLFNSALLINPEGSLATCYRKVLLYSADARWAAPGHRRPICPTAFGNMVPGICMDLNDDGFTAFLAEHRPALVPFCTNWTEEGVDVLGYWRSRLRGLGCCFVAANTWGEDEGVGFSGESAILGPQLELLARGPKRGDAVVYAELPLQEHGGADVR